MSADERSGITEPAVDRPTSARVYGWLLGGKDNYEVDRRFALAQLAEFPAGLDITRQNRQFLFRAVRYLAQEAGVRQFVDMGCGLPTDDNVHQVARRFVPDARVVYVDNDPIVLAHGRALLANDASTVVISADMRDQEAILRDPDVERLIDFGEPLAVLFLSVVHHLPDADDPVAVLRAFLDRAPAGSFVCLSQVVTDDAERGAAMTESIRAKGIPWQTRTPAEVDALVDGLEVVEPGFVDLAQWRPDPFQPALASVDPALSPYLGATKFSKPVYEYGGIARKP
jgi:S-adenosyl methyltransferase